jgi:putative transcriptional regulator
MLDRISFISELAKQDLRDGAFSALSGVSRSTVSAIKAGKTCSKDTAEKISKALDIPLCELKVDT